MVTRSWVSLVLPETSFYEGSVADPDGNIIEIVA